MSNPSKPGQKAHETRVSTKVDLPTTGPAPTSTFAPVEPSIVAPLVPQETQAMPLDNLTTSTPLPADETKDAGSQAVAVPVSVAPAESPKKATPKEDKVILSISVPARLARQAKILVKLEGISLSALFLESASQQIPARLKTALAALNDEEEV